MLTGLVSVTFRQLSPDEIVSLVTKAGLDGIEWGADIHCPPGQIEKAKEIASLMADNRLKTISYGSYYRVGTFDSFDEILESAAILGTKNIRVWAGSIGSKIATEDDWQKAVEDSKRIADLALNQNIDISFEYHGDTLTDTIETTERLLSEIDRDNIFSYWQPPVGLSFEDNISSIKRLTKLNKLKNFHIFSWENEPNGVIRQPLETKGEDWIHYIKEASNHVEALLLEFVKDDDPAQFLIDAEYLFKIKGK